MNNRPKPQNPWNKNQPNQKRPTKEKGLNGVPQQSDTKFKEAQKKLQAAVEKYSKDYESSSEEEEIESEQIIESLLKSYAATGGSGDNVARTEGFLKNAFISGAVTCLICISKVKRDDEIWSCEKCYCFFHLMCIQRWSKDSVVQKKQALESPIQVKQISLTWGCPKCRQSYDPEDIPSKYTCFCTKTTNPKYQPLLVPHSCGEICKKDLKPKCGHQCLLLCHPGPCPPCPVTVQVKCFCGSKPERLQRCSHREWSCGDPCKKLLECGKHTCLEACHNGNCKPCAKKSIQRCLCKAQQALRDCSAPIWQCEKVCNKPLECGNHKCNEVCHSGVCDMCQLAKERTCPCGKTKHHLPCTEDTPTCKDTCGKLLECGLHFCGLKCHRDKCGACLETVEKRCRCGSHLKEVQCSKPYLCETKCKNIKDCNKHPCNRKCCDGNCSACEKPCGKTLSCGNHKCASICHRGPCYPCNLTDIVTCRCGNTKMTVPCGRKHKTKPPKCSLPCEIPPDCHHEKRSNHRCHFGDCPPCKQSCDKPRPKCVHNCSAACHSSVLIKTESQTGSMPWEQTGPKVERKKLPCPDCVVPVSVTCFGEHETCDWPCYIAKPSSCQRPCGRMLPCNNHFCSLPCHVVENAEDKIKSGTTCETCDNPCSKERPEGCVHPCPKACHPQNCPPCKQMLRIKCHCGLTQPYIACSDWLCIEKREIIQSCGNQCPKNFDCGHRCRENCHSGPCPNAMLCKKKVKITCKCKRIKKEFQCELIRKNEAKVDCDEICEKQKQEQTMLKEALNEQKKKENEIKNQKELEKYQKMFEGKRKNKERRRYEQQDERTFLEKYYFALAILLILLAVGLSIFLMIFFK